MFVAAYQKRMEKWEKQIIDTLINSFEKKGWENVYFNELSLDDRGYLINIIRVNEIYDMARKMINGKKVSVKINQNYTFRKVKSNNTLLLWFNGKAIYRKVQNDYDLLFIKPQVIITKEPKDPLREWCQQFLKEYSKKESQNVDEVIENIPSYKPTKKQLTKYQKQREKDLAKITPSQM